MKAPKIVTAQEMGSGLIADALNMRFSMFLVRFSAALDLDYSRVAEVAGHILEGADISQD